MNTTLVMDEESADSLGNPGAKLAAMRTKLGYSQEYVAGKLHLRVRLIELLEADEYDNLPETVFIKGYIRAYAKLVDINPEPLMQTFDRLHPSERKFEKALWQSQRETHKAEYAIRWLTGFFAIAVLVAVAVWWYSNKDNERLFPTNMTRADSTTAASSVNKSENEIRLTDLSKMRSLLSPPAQSSTLEQPSE